MSLNNNADQVKPFAIEYSQEALICEECKRPICESDLRIAPKVESHFFDGYIKNPWYHWNCIFKSFSKPNHWNDIENFYLVRYEDQLKVAAKMNFCFNEKSDVERKIKSESDEFFSFRDNLANLYSCNELQLFLIANGYSYDFPRLRYDKLNRAAEFLTFGATQRCPRCSFGNLIYVDNVYQCWATVEGSRCMETTETPKRKWCDLTDELMEIFPDYEHRVKDRTLRAVFKDKKKHSRPEDNTDDEGKPEPKKQKIFFKNNAINDSGADFTEFSHVYKSEKGITYAVCVTKNEPKLNINRFYKLKILKDDYSDGIWLLKEWGRIGTERKDYTPKEKSSIDEAIKAFEEKFYDLTGNQFNSEFYKPKAGKYVYLWTDYNENKAESLVNDLLSSHDLEAPVKDLLSLMFSREIMNQTLMEFEIDANVMPNGMLSKENLFQAWNVLKTINDDIDKNLNRNNNSFDINTQQFHHLVPQRNVKIINNAKALSKKFKLLNNLRKIEVAFKFTNEDQNPILENYFSLDTDIKPLDVDSENHSLVVEYCTNTFSQKHFKNHFAVEQVFEIECQVDEARFKLHENCTNRQLLWHGSEIVNFPSILKHGLMISPPSKFRTTGKMFGRGIYFANMASKATLFVNRHENQQHALLLLCEVALGNMYEVTRKLGKDFSGKDLPEGKNSVKAIGKTFPGFNQTLKNGLIVPLGYLETDETLKSEVNFDEFVVFDESRIKMKYLVRVRFTETEEK